MDQTAARFRPYEGGEPYIFASYSHADSETVLPILDALHKRGFRVWYDQGIGWTKQWRKEVADHVAGCDVCIAFISAASRDSEHCNAELTFADSSHKKILRVYLEEVKLTSDLEMYLSRYQSVKWKDFAGMGAFLDEMERQDAVRDCKIQPVWHYDGGSGGIRWNLSGDGVLTIAARNPSYPAKMPDYNCYWMTIIGTAPWMREGEKIASVVIERGITTIGDFAFRGCMGLTSVRIPDSVKTIGGAAFAYCENLKEISLPAGVEFYGSSFPPDAKITVRR